jgi:hypothetical protein
VQDLTASFPPNPGCYRAKVSHKCAGFALAPIPDGLEGIEIKQKYRNQTTLPSFLGFAALAV